MNGVRFLKISIIAVFLLAIVATLLFVFWYVFADHIISSVKIKSSVQRDRIVDEYTITSTCRVVSANTVAPYVSVHVNSFEVLTTAVHPGYDTVWDCLRSSIEKVELVESEKKLRVFMKGGQIKEIRLIYDSSE